MSLKTGVQASRDERAIQLRDTNCKNVLVSLRCSPLHLVFSALSMLMNFAIGIRDFFVGMLE